MNDNKLPSGVTIETTKDKDGNVIAAKAVHSKGKSKSQTRREEAQESDE